MTVQIEQMKGHSMNPVNSIETQVQQIRRRGEFSLPCSADVAFPFFSPEGEREWIKAWNPRPVFPETIEFRADTIFREGHGQQDAVWTIVAVDWPSHRAEYVRVAPESHTAHIVVKVEPRGAESSSVTASFTVTILGEAGANLVDKFSESAYAVKMQTWQHDISDALARR